GRTVSVEELCRDCPHLLDELRRCVRALKAIDPLVQVAATPSPDGPPPQPQEAPVSITSGPGPIGHSGPELPAVPGYEVLREIGRGGMGVVYLARQTRLNRLVALKMLLADACTSEQRRRFRVEAELIARLQHPNIVAIYEVGEVAGQAFCALEYIDG